MNKNNYHVFSLLLISVMMFAVGCKDKMGGTYPMTIKVTLDQVPLDGATVSLFQLSGDGHTATGITDALGNAIIKSTEGWEGVFPGEYTVTVKKTEYSTSTTPPKGAEVDHTSSDEEGSFSISKELLPEKYGSTKTSGLTVTQESKKGSFEFDISMNP